MMHGDISNQRSFVIGFRCEGTLFQIKNDNFFDKVRNTIKGGVIKGADVNEEVLSLMNYLYYNTEMTTVLIVDEENYKSGVEEFLLDYPASQHKVILRSISEITMMLNTGELTYFVTNDLEEKSRINSKYAVTIDEMNNLIKRRVKRFE